MVKLVFILVVVNVVLAPVVGSILEPRVVLVDWKVISLITIPVDRVSLAAATIIVMILVELVAKLIIILITVV